MIVRIEVFALIGCASVILVLLALIAPSLSALLVARATDIARMVCAIVGRDGMVRHAKSQLVPTIAITMGNVLMASVIAVLVSLGKIAPFAPALLIAAATVNA